MNMSNFGKEVIEFVEKSDMIHKKIMNFIGYNFDNNSPIEVSNSPWGMSGTQLRIFTDGNCDDYYEYTISSYSNKGEKLFMNNDNDIYLIMAYPSDGSYNETIIFLFKEVNKIILDF